MVAGGIQQLSEMIAGVLGWHAGELGQQQANGAHRLYMLKMTPDKVNKMLETGTDLVANVWGTSETTGHHSDPLRKVLPWSILGVETLPASECPKLSLLFDMNYSVQT